MPPRARRVLSDADQVEASVAEDFEDDVSMIRRATRGEIKCYLCGELVHEGAAGIPPLYYCEACGTGFQWPQPTPEELAEYYDGTLDTTYLFKYSAVATARATLHNRTLERSLEPGRMLDVGCGTGDYLAFFAAKGWQCEGLELSSTLAEVGRDRHGLDVVSNDFMTHGFEHRYEVVSAQHVLEHMNDPVAFLRRTRELLVDDGFLLLAVPNYDSLLRRTVGCSWICRAEPTHLFHFTTRSIRRLAKIVGFTPLVCTTWQYEMADVLWALKQKARGRRGATERRFPGSGSPLAAAPEGAPRGALQRALIRLSRVLRSSINASGYGAEIIAVLRAVPAGRSPGRPVDRSRSPR